MAPRKPQTPSTPPTGTTVPQRTGDPNVPDEITFETPVPGAGGSDEAQPSAQFSVFNQEKFDEAFGRLRNMTLAYRLELLNSLRKKGFGSAAEVSKSGLEAPDVDRFKELLVYQYVNNRPLSDVINVDLNKIFPDIRNDDKGVRRTPQQDVDRVFSDVMRVKLGRGPTAQEKERFRSAYSSMEAGENAPSVQSAAEEQIVAKNTNEERANRFAGYMNVFERMLRSA